MVKNPRWSQVTDSIKIKSKQELFSLIGLVFSVGVFFYGRYFAPVETAGTFDYYFWPPFFTLLIVVGILSAVVAFLAFRLSGGKK